MTEKTNIKIESKRETNTRSCDGCGKTLKENDIWYPFFDSCRCGGGILYKCGACSIEQIMSLDKSDLLDRLKDAEGETDDPLSNGMINFHSHFPISPVHWINYAIEDDREEIKKILFKFWGSR